ncbi:MAG: sulfatase-like hydrolase/transferase [Clostridia bacterium]|nr:sulfatase-like hydrolase/transferase [Clostridia bacterium]
MEPKTAQTAKPKEKKALRSTLPACLIFSGVWLFEELLMRLGTTTENFPFFSVGLIFTPLLTFCFGFLIYGLCSFLPRRARAWVSTVCLALFTVLCISQLTYFHIFGDFFVVFSMRTLGQAFGDFHTVFFNHLPQVLVYWLVMLAALGGWIWFTVHFRQPERESRKRSVRWLLLSLGLYAVFFIGLLLGGRGDLSPWRLYWNALEVNPSMRTFGAVNTLRLDIKYQLFGTRVSGFHGDTPADLPPVSAEPTDPTSSPEGSDVSETSEPPKPVAYNVMDIDFDALKQQSDWSLMTDLNDYLSSITPTEQNEYTGLFKGKNVIMITAEAFHSCAVDETLTPTLYKMAHEGLEFPNYYSPGWGVSTLDGEYANLVGLIPKAGVWSLWRARTNNLYFTLGNVTERLGYKTLAYHNHTYDYYSRDESHFNLGYTYKGIGNGLTLSFNGWPRSDEEMIDVTTPEYLSGSDPFSVYYLTVSGHAPYSYGGNSMSARNWDAVKDLDCSDEAKAYLASQIELDKAMKLLLTRLEEAGKLDDTLIVLAADHYPYGLSTATVQEFLGDQYDPNFEIYHNTLIVYNPNLPHRVIDKPCYSVDILPTVLNLMGAEFDSRLLIGTDILSRSQGLVVFLNRSWITAYGRYNASTGVFTPAEGVNVPDAYVDSVNAVVSKKFSVSSLVLDEDYYGLIFGATPHTAP